MTDKTKKIIANAGIAFTASVILAFLVDSAITYVPRASTIANHIMTIGIMTVFFYILIYLLIRFIIWAVKH